MAEGWELLRGLRCRSARHLSGWNTAWESWGVHRHCIPSLVIGLAGRSQLDIAPGEILRLGPGDLVLVDPFVWHIDRRPLDGGTTLVTGRVGPVMDLELIRADSRWLGETPWAGLPGRIAAIARARTDAGRRAAGDRLLAELARRAPRPRDFPEPVQRMVGVAWRLRFQTVTARQILAASGLSYAVAHDLFVRHFGEPPKRYLLRTRVELAQHLLRCGRPLDETWREAGFASRADLTRRFRLMVGQPPLAWQRRNRG